MFADAAKPRGQHATPRAGARRPWDGVRHPPAAVGPQRPSSLLLRNCVFTSFIIGTFAPDSSPRNSLTLTLDTSFQVFRSYANLTTKETYGCHANFSDRIPLFAHRLRRYGLYRRRSVRLRALSPTALDSFATRFHFLIVQHVAFDTNPLTTFSRIVLTGFYQTNNIQQHNDFTRRVEARTDGTTTRHAR